MTSPETIEQAKEFFPEGSTVYCVLRKCSRSGMQRTIGLVTLRPAQAQDWDTGRCKYVVDIRHPNYIAAKVLGMKADPQKDGIAIRGCGMDMGFALVDALSHKLYGRAGALKHEWL